MAVLRTVPTSRVARSQRVDDAVPCMSLDALDAAAMLGMALAPTAFVLATALQMLGVHAI